MNLLENQGQLKFLSERLFNVSNMADSSKRLERIIFLLSHCTIVKDDTCFTDLKTNLLVERHNYILLTRLIDKDEKICENLKELKIEKNVTLKK
jgi:hypothetical protein